MDTTALREHRRRKDAYFLRSPHSPLDLEERRGFRGLAYYEPSADMVFTLPLLPADGNEVRVQTSDGQERLYRRAGVVEFTVQGAPARLTLYATGHHGYFVPFRDATSGRETYGAGRYLDLDPATDGVVTLDFNYAYYPFCAYGDAYSCPLPPVENWLALAIEAGERDRA